MFVRALKNVESRIEAACTRADRRREEITLIAVTKTQHPPTINEALGHGVTDIGENRVQEYLGKRDELELHRFHMIGALQSNKVRQIISIVDMIHSVDRMSLAKEIEKRAGRIPRIVPCLIEVNTSGEESKEGCAPDDVEQLVEAIAKFEHIDIRGLMTVAEYVQDPEDVRPSFRLLRELGERIKPILGSPEKLELSMGMTNDFEIAIEEGATMIRIGSALFGPRT